MQFAALALGIIVVSSISSLILLKRKHHSSETPVRWLAFGLYFWLLTFLQLSVGAGIYACMQIKP